KSQSLTGRRHATTRPDETSVEPAEVAHVAGAEMDVPHETRRTRDLVIRVDPAPTTFEKVGVDGWIAGRTIDYRLQLVDVIRDKPITETAEPQLFRVLKSSLNVGNLSFFAGLPHQSGFVIGNHRAVRRQLKPRL
ncbi:MAG: hypothetical protein WA777_15200, partial [Rhodanobacter sp.]